MALAVCALALLASLGAVSGDEIRCVPTDDNGNEVLDSLGRRYDLTPLRRRPPNAEWKAKDISEKNEYTYTINVCDRIYSNSEASNTHAAVWQVKVGQENQVFECGDATTAKITLVEDGALRLTYKEGGHCHRADTDRNTIISLVCKKSMPSDNPPSLINEDNCTYSFEWLTPYACPVTEASNSGMGFFGTFFLLLFLSIVGYVFGGTAYRFFVLKKSWPDAFPNFDLWSNLCESVTTFCQGACSRVLKRGGAGMGRPGTVHYRGLATEGSQDSLIAEEDDDRLLDS
eukprot:comp21169_c0_seq1/m.28693 comp21169_c0_seq1/g.28693  ORF comp21169_c0_seq1/g.28693 comp21169_c0_seq1/m.28693 type:complete len:287 (-) comp21169_c0_seq1:202-1062(-)